MIDTPINDLRKYISVLLERREMAVVEKEVNPRFELAAVVSRSQKENDRPILFKKVKGTNFPVVANIYGSFNRISEMVNVKGKTLNFRWKEIIDSFTANTFEYIHEVPLSDDLIKGKLSDLPNIIYREKDAAPYITAGVFLANDPDTGVPNLSFARCMMLGLDNKMYCCIDPPHDLAKYQAKAEAKGEALEVAILIGAPPPVFLAAVTSLPIDQDELKLAALISGGRIDMRPCEHLDMLVPAATEIVIETTIRPNERVEEGPFGEFLGYYCDVNDDGYILDVLNVSWRNNAYYQGLLCGAREDLTALAISLGGRIYQELVDKLPGIIDVTVNPTLYSSIIKIEKKYEGHVRDVINTVFKINPLHNRMCIVVDKDIDVHDLNMVWWSFLTRGDIDTRTYITSELPGVDNPDDETSGYLGIDATMPLRHQLIRATTPGEDCIDLNEYLVNP